MMLEQQFGKFRILGLVGVGGVSTVYHAVDDTLNREVALKILNSLQTPGSVEARRFQRELEIAQRLEHPHIISIYEYGEIGHRLYLAMEYMAKGSLAQVFSKPVSIRLGESAKILRVLASALDYAHAHGVIHRDLKLENILIARRNRPVLTDFGIARLPNHTRLTMTGQVLGTPLYMSPEQFNGTRNVDHRADLYSLGVIAFLLATGYFPFTSDSALYVLNQQLTSSPPLPSNLNPRLPRKLDDVLLKGLAKNPDERFPSAGEFAATFKDAIRGVEDSEVVIRTSQPTPILSPKREYAGVPTPVVNIPATVSAVKARRRTWWLPYLVTSVVIVVSLVLQGVGGGIVSDLPTATENPVLIGAPATATPSSTATFEATATRTSTSVPTSTRTPSATRTRTPVPTTQPAGASTTPITAPGASASAAPANDNPPASAPAPTSAPPTSAPPTSVPPTSVPPTPVPPTPEPPTSAPPTDLPLIPPIVPTILSALPGM